MQSISGAVQLIERRIYLIRGQKMMLDFDLAELYDMPTKRSNERVSRNKKRFPKDFMFRLTQNEADVLRSQFVISSASKSNLRSHIATSKTGHGGTSLSAVRVYRTRRGNAFERAQIGFKSKS